jgi:hypothetical protein
MKYATLPKTWNGHVPDPGSHSAQTAIIALLAFTFLAAWGEPATAEHENSFKVYAHTFKHQKAQDILPHIRPLLSLFGTVEEQPGRNTLVIRDIPAHVTRIIPLVKAFDHPPEKLRFNIQIISAGPKGRVDESTGERFELPAEMVEKFRRFLRFDDYRVLAQAGLTSREGEDVTYALGEDYSVRFRLGTMTNARGSGNAKRLRLKDFQVFKHVRNPTNKGRQLEPRELYRATFNVWVDRPLNLVLPQDESRQEALMVVISCRREVSTP